ncbi:MAG: hypothetical protein ABSE41_17520, partial [Bacteroidota bacterium]
LTLQGGIGTFAVRDEYISGEKYSGSIPFYGVTWSKYHETYGFRLHLEYQHAPDLKNFNVSSDIQQFRVSIEYLYPIADAIMCSKSVKIFLGPTAELYEYHRKDDIIGPENLQSNIGLVSGGIKAEAFWLLNERLRVQAAAHTTLLSMGFHTVNSNSSSESSSKPLMPFKGVDADGEIAVSYQFMKSLNASIGYRFDVTRVSAWEYFIAADDNLIVSLSYAF